MTTTLTTNHGQMLHRPSGSGPAFWGRGDSYRARYAEAAPRYGMKFLG